MRKTPLERSSSVAADALIFLLIVTLIQGTIAFGQQWQSSYNPNYEINLSLNALPLYAFFSALRGFVAYLVSLAFTLVVGYWAAKSEKAETFILPFLDIMQSIPVLGFLPGLVLGLVALFPHTNVGLELASIVMIFSGQVWNMTFALYSSLKSVPTDLKEAAEVMKLSPLDRLRLLELPFSAMNLTWNSVMSMAGGWFFLTVCEAFTLGDKPYRLPGLGAYMAAAIDAGDNRAMFGAVFSMALVIILFDMLLWRPALVWAHRYRLEESENQKIEEPFIQLLIRESFMVRFFRNFFQRPSVRRKKIRARIYWHGPHWRPHFKIFSPGPVALRALRGIALVLVILAALTACVKLIEILMQVELGQWGEILRDTFFTFLRVMMSLVIGTLWATPTAIWIAQSSKRLQVAQPIIQLLASFPAPMLYPLAIVVFLFLHINFEISAMLLMLMGVQWYILFNVLAGALRIPQELRLSMQLMKSSKWHQWRYLFFPSVLPALVTGWVTAAGGAWNASIAAEIISYKGQTFRAHGLGRQISEATEHGEFAKLAACLVVMVVVVVAFNRTVWKRLYRTAQLRFRLDL